MRGVMSRKCGGGKVIGAGLAEEDQEDYTYSTGPAMAAAETGAIARGATCRRTEPPVWDGSLRPSRVHHRMAHILRPLPFSHNSAALTQCPASRPPSCGSTSARASPYLLAGCARCRSRSRASTAMAPPSVAHGRGSSDARRPLACLAARAELAAAVATMDDCE